MVSKAIPERGCSVSCHLAYLLLYYGRHRALACYALYHVFCVACLLQRVSASFPGGDYSHVRRGFW